jgi:hypothetical protein
MGALEELQVLDICAEQNVRLTFFLFPTDDTESMTNAGRLFLYAGDRVDYVIVNNPAKARGDLFRDSPLQQQLTDFGAKAVTLPLVTPTTLLAMEKAESVAQRGLSFAELSHPEAKHLERLLAGEIQWAMAKMFRQYYDIADLLLPSELVPGDKPAGEPARLELQPKLNFGE